MGSLFVVFILAIFLIILISKGLIIVRQAETIIIERLGSYHRTLNNGLHIIWPIIDRPRQMIWRYIKTDVNGKNFIIQKNQTRIDLREIVYDFPRQDVITRDNVTIEINALLYFQITDSYKVVYEINNLPNAIEKLTQTTLRNVIGELELDKTLSSRDIINSRLRDILDDATDKWGVKINRVEIQDINPPIEIKSAMEKQMRAERDKRAKILEAEGQKMSQILVAEGDKNAQVTRSEGEAQARLIVAEAEAKAIQKVAESLKATGSDPAQYLIALKYIKAFDNLVQNGDKTVVLPYESSSLLGSVKTIGKLFNES
jgi:regulator of protease activity HflC (stomatin/prohibitin superfamily)